MLDPLSYDIDQLGTGASLGSLSAFVQADARSNITGLYTPSDNRWAVRRVAYTFSLLGPGLEPLEPLVTQFYPSHQETIWGTEGLILTQRVFVPYATAYERAVCWLIEVQAEGPRLLQVEIELEFEASTPPAPFPHREGGEEEGMRLQPPSLTSGEGRSGSDSPPSLGEGTGVGSGVLLRLQDGLLVATDATDPHHVRVFGSSGPPTHVDLDTPGRARLFYHVLIEGEVEQPFVLTTSDAGESLAWNGFLILSDTERVFKDTVRNLDQQLAVSRVFTPDPAVNRAIEWAKVNTLRVQQRWRWGYGVPTMPGSDSLNLTQAAWYALGANWAYPDFVGRMLALLAQHAQAEDGRLAATLHVHRLTRVDSADQSPTTLFLAALGRHLITGSDVYAPFSNLQTQYPAIRAAADALAQRDPRHSHMAETAWALNYAALVAESLGHTEDAQRYAAVAGAFDSVSQVRWLDLIRDGGSASTDHLAVRVAFPLIARLSRAPDHMAALLNSEAYWGPFGFRNSLIEPTPVPQAIPLALTVQIALALREHYPARVVETLRLACAVAEAPHPAATESVPGQFPAYLNSATGQAAGPSLDPLVGPLLLWLALEGLAGLTLEPGLGVYPHMPADWPWIAVADVPFQGQKLSLAYIDGVIHTNYKINALASVQYYDQVRLVDGPVFALLFRRNAIRRLFAASNTATTTFIRVDGRSIPVQLEAGQAILINL